MKPYYFTLAIVLIGHFAYAGTSMHRDTTIKPPVVKETKGGQETFIAIEQVPEFPGGLPALGSYISHSLKYPEVARLIGINGRVMVTFTVDTTGRVTNVTPINCIGAGCEAEAARVLENSPLWKPGIQKGRPVNVKYAVPITFSSPGGKVQFKDLKKSSYGFVFEIKSKRYTLTEAKELLGDSFKSEDVQIAEPFYNADNNDKFDIPGKTGIYLILMKDK
ncbi:energy transducer TonB [Mucilaginibacter sp.]|uniref:energy transducer TonB n=1 Tax=Mucilaginibacter sp. TaxID=1882438 RepID=UPI002ED1EE4A